MKGKFVFGDIARGRLFAADVAALKAADDGIPSTVAAIEEIQLFVRDVNGNQTDVSLRQLAERLMGPLSRVDLQLGRGSNGELYLTSRQDGMIRTLVPEGTTIAVLRGSTGGAMVVEIKGVELHYEAFGEGEPLLWVHGFMGAGPDWRYVDPHFFAPTRRRASDSSKGVLKRSRQTFALLNAQSVAVCC